MVVWHLSFIYKSSEAIVLKLAQSKSQWQLKFFIYFFITTVSLIMVELPIAYILQVAADFLFTNVCTIHSDIDE